LVKLIRRTVECNDEKCPKVPPPCRTGKNGFGLEREEDCAAENPIKDHVDNLIVLKDKEFWECSAGNRRGTKNKQRPEYHRQFETNEMILSVGQCFILFNFFKSVWQIRQ